MAPSPQGVGGGHSTSASTADYCSSNACHPGRIELCMLSIWLAVLAILAMQPPACQGAGLAACLHASLGSPAGQRTGSGGLECAGPRDGSLVLGARGWALSRHGGRWEGPHVRTIRATLGRLLEAARRHWLPWTAQRLVLVMPCQCLASDAGRVRLGAGGAIGDAWNACSGVLDGGGGRVGPMAAGAGSGPKRWPRVIGRLFVAAVPATQRARWQLHVSPSAAGVAWGSPSGCGRAWTGVDGAWSHGGAPPV